MNKNRGGCVRNKGGGVCVEALGSNLQTQLLDGEDVDFLGGRLCFRCRVSYVKLGFRFESRGWV